MVDSTDRSGQRLEQYHLIRRLGGGAFGDVYLAEDHRKRRMAIKIIRGEMSEQQLHTFLQEARIIRLRHEHIVSVQDFNIDQNSNTAYIVMDYASKGTMLSRHPRGSRLPLSTVVIYANQIGAALYQAHEEGIIHRDVKPENILIDEYGTIKLADFGLAVIAQSAYTSIQNPQGKAGTPWYMAPEQIKGKASRSSDQYSLAIIIYEWLTGTPPFVGNMLEVYGQHIYNKPDPLPKDILYLTPAIEAVIMKALSKEVKERYPNVQAFAKALKVEYEAASGGRGGNQWNNIPIPREPSDDKKNNAEAFSTRSAADEAATQLRGKAEKRIDDLSKEGNAYHDAGRYDDAIAVWNQIVQRNNKDAVVYYNRGNAYFQKGQYQKAIDDYEQAIQLNPSYADAYNMRGLAYYKQFKHDKAIEDYIKAIKHNPSYAFAYYHRGLARAAQYQYQQAINDYEQAIRLGLKHADVYNDRGIAYYNLAEYYKAIKDYEHALQLEPNHPLARNNIINAQRKLREQGK